MSINKFNSEGYYDPTTYEALTNIEKEERALRAFRPIVYICSPYAGDVEVNVENARKYSRFAVDMGYIPRLCSCVPKKAYKLKMYQKDCTEPVNHAYARA